MPISLIHRVKTTGKLFFFKALKIIHTLMIVKKTYKNVPTYSLSKQYRRMQEPNNPDLIYGTLSIGAFLYLLALLPKSKSCKIYDLGCGDAKLILSATIFFEYIDSVGIEKVSSLAQAASGAQLSVMGCIENNQSSLTIVEADFLKVNFIDADIIYVNGAVFQAATWKQLCHRFSQLQTGCYIISVVQKILNHRFELVYTGIHPASWGKTKVYIYQVISRL